ncbi:MBOAT family O-acyltransferase [Xylophilus sp. GOD-11R]|uniref:MBOAT family O-acyltransferase n=1 Tax=Xylophilus sp. GOD-11R TaxID=3089814 RepID=UPI00298BDD84|nr:MBOAT family O-acyltransferase [Xylophilus sp. GOD-11R]WPB59001.1 MBOAT family O-acyltransferase [Xylophilus sp. GOD-11R]
MTFVSGSFLLGFLPALLIIFTLATRYAPVAAMPLLLAGSVLFYLMADAASLPLLVGSLLINYGVGRAMDASQGGWRRAWLGVGVVLNLLPLFWFKYGGGLHLGASQAAGSFVGSGIPLGLSFYTFGQLSFLFDVFRGEPARLGLVRHGLFASFFAQLPAGPITRWRDLAPQIASIGQRAVPLATVAAGVSLFIFGLVKKSLFGDSLGHFVNAVHLIADEGRSPNIVEAWLATWGFVLQLYFDFSGYSDMAIGAAMCFGLKLAVNFNSPLKAATASQWVDRWHMSLVGWIREYLYPPVFNLTRRLPFGPPQRMRIIGWAVGTIASMSVIGAWHGSEPLLWGGGIVFGVVLVLMQLPALLWPRKQRKADVAGAPGRSAVARAMLLLFIAMLILSVRARDAGTLIIFLEAMFDPTTISLPGALRGAQGWLPGWVRFDGMLPGVAYVWRFDMLVLVTATAIGLWAPNTMQLFGLVPAGVKGSVAAQRVERWRWRPTAAWGLVMGVMLVLAVLFTGSLGGQEFIYARF